MTKHMVSVGDSFSAGWRLYEENCGFWFKALLLGFVVCLCLMPFILMWGANNMWVFGGIHAVQLFLRTLIHLGFASLGLAAIDQQELNMATLFKNTRQSIRAIVVTIVFALFAAALLGVGMGVNKVTANIPVLNGILIAVLVCIGIYVLIRWVFYMFLLVDKGANVFEALKGSWDITRHNFWVVFWFTTAAILLNVLGALVLLVGLFITVPISTIAAAHLYRRLAE